MMLVSIATYRSITGDTDSADELVTSALADAQSLIEEELRRGIELLERTEVLAVINGRVYPSVTPIISADYEIEGNSLLDPETLDFDFYYPDEPLKASVTYTGGWTAETLPYRLKEAICRVGYQITHPTLFDPSIPAGATSVRNGDVQITWGSSGANSASTAISSEILGSISRYRRVEP